MIVTPASDKPGAVKLAQIKKAPSGVFSIKVVAVGKNGPIFVTPPNPGTNSCVLLALNGGDTYSVKFGLGDGEVTNKDGALYKQKKVKNEGTCRVPVSSGPTARRARPSLSASPTSSTDRVTERPHHDGLRGHRGPSSFRRVP